MYNSSSVEKGSVFNKCKFSLCKKSNFNKRLAQYAKVNPNLILDIIEIPETVEIWKKYLCDFTNLRQKCF